MMTVKMDTFVKLGERPSQKLARCRDVIATTLFILSMTRLRRSGGNLDYSFKVIVILLTLSKPSTILKLSLPSTGCVPKASKRSAVKPQIKINF